MFVRCPPSRGAEETLRAPSADGLWGLFVNNRFPALLNADYHMGVAHLARVRGDSRCRVGNSSIDRRRRTAGDIS